MVYPVFAMVAMVLPVSAVLANSFGSQLLSGENVDSAFSVSDGETDPVADGVTAGQAGRS